MSRPPSDGVRWAEAVSRPRLPEAHLIHPDCQKNTQPFPARPLQDQTWPWHSASSKLIPAMHFRELCKADSLQLHVSPTTGPTKQLVPQRRCSQDPGRAVHTDRQSHPHPHPWLAELPQAQLCKWPRHALGPCHSDSRACLRRNALQWLSINDARIPNKHEQQNKHFQHGRSQSVVFGFKYYN